MIGRGIGLLKEIEGQETKEHLCESIKISGKQVMFDQPRRLGAEDGVRIYIHDVHPYFIVENENKIHKIKFCPYCGVDIDKDRS